MQAFSYIRRFGELGIDDVPLVGGKNASLGEMYQALSGEGVKVPNGFATTAQAYRDYLQYNDLEDRVRQALDDLDVENVDDLRQFGLNLFFAPLPGFGERIKWRLAPFFQFHAAFTNFLQAIIFKGYFIVQVKNGALTVFGQFGEEET